MRLFVALTPPEEVLSPVVEHLGPRRAAEDGPRWIDPAHLHLTLAFMEAVDDWRLEGLIDRLAGVAARHRPLDLTLEGAGAFPTPERARVLWIGVTDASGSLRDLTKSVRGACNTEGARPDGRRFSPHLTVARFRRPTEATRWIRAIETLPPRTWAADRVSLVQSLLGQGRGGRPRHDVLETFALGATPADDPAEGGGAEA